jgi:hypothetical protein
MQIMANQSTFSVTSGGQVSHVTPDSGASRSSDANQSTNPAPSRMSGGGALELLPARRTGKLGSEATHTVLTGEVVPPARFSASRTAFAEPPMLPVVRIPTHTLGLDRLDRAVEPRVLAPYRIIEGSGGEHAHRADRPSTERPRPNLAKDMDEFVRAGEQNMDDQLKVAGMRRDMELTAAQAALITRGGEMIREAAKG